MKAIDIESYIKPAITVAAVGGSIYLVYKIWTKAELIGKTAKERRELNREQGRKLSFPKTQYKAYADALEKAWYEYVFGMGTDEAVVYSVFNALRTNDDYLELIKAYGVRPYRDGFFTANFNLVEAINYEDESSEMRNKINKILGTKKITYRL